MKTTTKISPPHQSMRSQIFSLLSKMTPHDALEEKHIQETLSWIQSDTPIFRIQKPDIPNKHLVSYFVLFDENHQKILLVDHIKANLWLPSGGHVEVDEHPKETVTRECFEELNIHAEFLMDSPLFLTSTTTVGSTAGHTDVSLWYLLKGDSTNFYAYDKEEFKAVQWFSFDDIPYHQSDPHMRRFIEKLKSTL